MSVVEESLLPFEEKLPSSAVHTFTVTPKVIQAPDCILTDLIEGQNTLKYEQEYNTALAHHMDYITQYVIDKWKVFSIRHGLTLTQIRSRMVAQYYTSHVMEIEDAVKQIKKFHDAIKEMEVEISKSYDLNLVFEEDAADFLVQQFIDHSATTEEILSKIYNDFYDGFNLIREKTGKSRFFLSKSGLIDHETYLNDLIRKELR